jgi:hypothetical protein
MEPLIIEETLQTPKVVFSGSTGVFTISGKSYPENVNAFYEEAFNYIGKYKSEPQKKTLMEFNWLYYNTATAKIIIKLILALKDASEEFELAWHCQKDFDLMIDKGKEIEALLGVNFRLVLDKNHGMPNY